MNEVLEPYFEAGKSITYLIAGTIFSIVTYYLIPSIFSVFEDLTSGSVDNVYVFALFVLWGILIIGLPIFKAGTAIQTIGSNNANRLIAPIWLIFGLMLTYVGWYTIPAIAGMIPDGIITTMFWIGTIITWLTVVIALPIVAIMKSHG